MCYSCSENKGADQLRSYCEADLRICFRMLVFHDAALCTTFLQEAIDWLSSHRAVYSGGIGVCGQSRGGMIGLLMAANSPKVHASS